MKNIFTLLKPKLQDVNSITHSNSLNIAEKNPEKNSLHQSDRSIVSGKNIEV